VRRLVSILSRVASLVLAWAALAPSGFT